MFRQDVKLKILILFFLFVIFTQFLNLSVKYLILYVYRFIVHFSTSWSNKQSFSFNFRDTLIFLTIVGSSSFVGMVGLEPKITVKGNLLYSRRVSLPTKLLTPSFMCFYSDFLEYYDLSVFVDFCVCLYLRPVSLSSRLTYSRVTRFRPF